MGGGPIFGSWFSRYSGDFFDRYGDGAVRGEIHALAGSTITPGDFARIDLETYPTLNTQTRGGAAGRTVQIISKEHQPDRYVFGYLDVGPALQALNAPTLTLSTLSGIAGKDPHHTLNVSVGGLSSQGAGYQLEIANSSTLPASNASSWKRIGLFITDGQSIGLTPSVSGLPSGSTWWGRARATKAGRVRSAWTNSTKKATQAMGAPTNINVATSNINAPNATVTWSISTSTAKYSDRYRPLTVHWDESTVAPISSTNPYIVPLPAGSNQYTMTNLSANSTYKVGVRYYDGIGGVSPSDSTTFQTSGATLTCTTVKNLSLTWGSA